MGVVDMNFALWPTELVRYQPKEAPPIQIGWEWHPENFTWSGWGGSSYRYFVVHAPREAGSFLFGTSPCRISLEAEAGELVVVRIALFHRRRQECVPSRNTLTGAKKIFTASPFARDLLVSA